MTDEPLDNFTFKSRFSDLIRATDSIRNLVYQIRRLKTVHGELKFKEFDLRELISNCLDEVRRQLPNLRVDPYLAEKKVMCSVDYETISFSLIEILNNSCRELKENNVESPVIEIYLDIDGTNASIAIQDNALPINQLLIERPFDEGSTKYRGGKGSGLGLTVVRDTFKRHNGSCELLENREENGERKPGVTFRAKIPLLAKEN
jgi:signal transduction histidine kinase